MDEANLPTRLLLQSGENHWTYAHTLASKGVVFTRDEVLRIADVRGITVAHVMASMGYIFSDPEILSLTANCGMTVESAYTNRIYTTQE